MYIVLVYPDGAYRTCIRHTNLTWLHSPKPGGRAPNGEGVLIWKAITINVGERPKIILLSWKLLGQKGSNDFIL